MITPIEPIEQALRATMDKGDTVVVQFLFAEHGGHGLVLYDRRNHYGIEYIVHSWATHDTDGDEFPDVRFYSGFYTMDHDAAVANFTNRMRRSIP